MPRNSFVVMLKQEDDKAVPVPQERASVPTAPERPVSRLYDPPSGRTRQAGRAHEDRQAQRSKGSDHRRRRSGASRFRG
jgi:hypothetical protein